MCGWFTLTSDLRALELRFNFRGDALNVLTLLSPWGGRNGKSRMKSPGARRF